MMLGFESTSHTRPDQPPHMLLCLQDKASQSGGGGAAASIDTDTHKSGMEPLVDRARDLTAVTEVGGRQAGTRSRGDASEAGRAAADANASDSSRHAPSCAPGNCAERRPARDPHS